MLLWLLLCAAGVSAAPCGRVKVNPDRWVSANVNALVSSARAAFDSDDAQTAYEAVLDRIANSIHRCRLADDARFASRYQRFLDYVAVLSLDRQPDHDLGFTVSNAQYFAETSQYLEIPKFLLEQDFLKAVSRYETLDRAKAFLRLLNEQRSPENKLIFFSYTSRHLGTPDNDNSFRRLLIVVPGDPERGLPEKWVQFGVTDPGVRRRTRNVSIVSALATADNTSNVYFRDFFRTYRRDGSIALEGRWELGEGDDNCVSCHKSGILPIFPEKGSVSHEEEAALLAVNGRFLSYGRANFGKYLDRGKFGPGLGAANAEDRARRFGPAFAQTAVGQAMNCVACHNAQRLGPLNWPMDHVLIGSYLKAGKMPAGHRLQVLQRRELFAKLVEEYFATDAAHPGILEAWLLSPPVGPLSSNAN
ncbi:MAG: hypothetical protein QOE77_2897 [Blastocatellia bacterium]|jgi:hypothetical protein|nr:hypothetical protein [Blastocatellia bacterium]